MFYKKLLNKEIDHVANLKKYKNKYKGESCILMGSAPSLTKIPFSVLKKYKTIASNASALYFTPDFICSADLKYPWFPEVRELAHNNSIPYFIKWANPPMDISLFNKESFKYYPNEIHLPFFFERDMKKEAINILELFNNPNLLEKPSGSSAGVVQNLALPLAFYMGFDTIYLAGIDFNKKTNEKNLHFYEETILYKSQVSYVNRKRWMIELINKSNKKGKLFSLTETCDIKGVPYIDPKTI